MFIRDMMNRVRSFIAESCSYEFVTLCKLNPSDPYLFSIAQKLSAQKSISQECWLILMVMKVMMHVMVMSMKVLTRLKMTNRLISLFPA